MKILMVGAILQSLNLLGAFVLFYTFPYNAQEVVIVATNTSYINGCAVGVFYEVCKKWVSK